ncbi:NAD-binding protein [soil metagenome]
MMAGGSARRPRVLIVGAGDVGSRVIDQLDGRAIVVAMVRRRGARAQLHRPGVASLVADLDRRASLQLLHALDFDAVIHLAPPQSDGRHDLRTRALVDALTMRPRPGLRFVYVSTSGVYGDQGGAQVDEDTPARPRNARARRRIDAERTLASAARRNHWHLSVLRAPGIYAADRLPIERLRAGTPAIHSHEDSWSNHIHADDLAGLCIAALRSHRALRIYNASDDRPLPMGDWFDKVADRFALPRPPRVSREDARRSVSASLWSFMAESRRLSNRRASRELRYRLRWPDVDTFLASLPPP